jgi:uncharacterized protein YtpQ (UPF0354 family)
MASKFTNLFKRTDLDEKNAFRQKVLTILRKNFPGYDFTEGNDFDQISVGEMMLGLTNLRAKFLLGSQTQTDLENLVKEQFGNLEKTVEYVNNISEQESWSDVKSLVMLQIMPIEYAEKFSAIHYPLADEVVIGVVIDDENSYRYATDNDANKWDVTAEEIYDKALENLEKKSNAIEMMVIPKPVGLVVINTMDSFDAARILLPRMREFFAEQIGTPFYFGIPNRDFLICFSAESDEETQRNIRKQIVTDNSERPYPLSSRTFIVDGKNEIKQLDFTEPNSPSNSAYLN